MYGPRFIAVISLRDEIHRIGARSDFNLSA